MINQFLSKRLLKMVERDQRARKRAMASGKLKDGLAIKKLDETHNHQLRRIIKRYGHPTQKLIGRRGMRAWWILAQHQDEDRKLQEACLVHCDFEPKEKAYLTDRVLVGQGKKQVYGTQFYRNARGQLVPRPIKDRKNLDKRRREAGMESFEKYQRAIRAIQRPKPPA
jgi:hypothetical protein